MRKQKIININMADLTDQKLINILQQTEAGPEEFMGIMLAFFDMFSAAVHFGSVLQEYAEKHHPQFIADFEQLQANVHSVPNTELIQAITNHQRQNDPTTYVH